MSVGFGTQRSRRLCGRRVVSEECRGDVRLLKRVTDWRTRFVLLRDSFGFGGRLCAGEQQGPAVRADGLLLRGLTQAEEAAFKVRQPISQG